MARDYAKRTLPKSKLPRRWRRDALFVVLLLCIVGGVIGWLTSPKIRSTPILLSHWISKLHHKPAEKSTAIPEVHASSEVHFDFYTTLPSMQMKVASTELPPPPVVTTVSYTLQLGLFEDNNSASQLRISLLLAGVNADIVPIKQNNHVKYRVQQGKYSTLALAMKNQRALEDKGIMSEVQKI